MKYTKEIIINLPLNKVIELFDSFDNLKKWQPGLINIQHISGEPGQAEAKTQLLYKMGKREIEMIETIVKRDLPKEFSATYEAKNVWNMVVNNFEELEQGKTKWITINEFKCKGFMAIMCALMPGAFKKQTYQHMKTFKEFAEKEANSPTTNN